MIECFSFLLLLQLNPGFFQGFVNIWSYPMKNTIFRDTNNHNTASTIVSLDTDPKYPLDPVQMDEN